jgi:hypothetical protein
MSEKIHTGRYKLIDHIDHIPLCNDLLLLFTDLKKKS